MCELKGKNKPAPKPTIDTSLPLSMVETGNDAIVHALKDLVFARELAGQAKTMEADAKQVLIAEAKAKGIDTLKGGGLSCTITERKSSRFDSAGFRQAHPTLAAQFTTEGTTTYFTLKEEF